MSKTVLLWDIDGTLLLTGGSGKTAFTRVFNDLYGIQEIWSGYAPAGKTDYLIIEELYQAYFGKEPQQEEQQRIAETYKKYLAEDVTEWDGFRLMPFAQETLQVLSEKHNVLQGIATGNFLETAQLKLKKGGLENYFSFGGYGDDGKSRLDMTRVALKRANEAAGDQISELYLIGDTIHDVRCGKAIGAKVVGVTVAGSSGYELKNAGADWVLNDLGEFFSAVMPKTNHQ